MNIREINDAEELDSLQEVWNELLAQTPQANFFQTLDWLQTYWKHFGEAQRLRILVIEEEGEACGILPLVVKQEWTKVGPLNYLTYPLDYWGSFYGPIGPDPDRVLAAGLEYLSNVGLDADVLELRWISDELCENDRVEHLLNSAQFSPVRSDLDSTSVINFSGITWPRERANGGTTTAVGTVN